jgi:hypothetical protein
MRGSAAAGLRISRCPDVVDFTRLIARRNQAQVGADALRSANARGIVDCSDKGQSSQLTNAGDDHEPTTSR